MTRRFLNEKKFESKKNSVEFINNFSDDQQNRY